MRSVGCRAGRRGQSFLHLRLHRRHREHHREHQHRGQRLLAVVAVERAMIAGETMLSEFTRRRGLKEVTWKRFWGAAGCWAAAAGAGAAGAGAAAGVEPGAGAAGAAPGAGPAASACKCSGMPWTEQITSYQPDRSTTQLMLGQEGSGVNAQS